MIRLITLILGALITLHTPSGREVYANGDEIMFIRPDGYGLYSVGCGALVTVHDKEVCVRESPAEVKSKVEGKS
jgi:hypothetical protein